MPSTEFTADERILLLRLAGDSIRHGLRHGRALTVDPATYPPHLAEARACFVTLHRNGRLRGCIGHLQARQPLVADVAENAWSAAFADPRFAPLGDAELDTLDIGISVLGVPETVEFSDEQDLLAQLRPGIDGLILQSPTGHAGTFLPPVWESLPQPHEFLAHLKQKAGLPRNYDVRRLQVWRYTTESF